MLFRRLTKIFAVGCAVVALAPVAARAQGCVAARGSGICAIHGDHGMASEDSQWEGSVSYRWLNSHRHFVGDEEQRQRRTQGSEVRNNSNFIDASVTYNITPR